MYRITSEMNITILKRFARGEGSCSGDYRWMPRETGTLCNLCRGRTAERREAAGAAAAEAAVDGRQLLRWLVI